MAANSIIIRPGNPLALPPAELEDLADAIRQLNESYTVEFEQIEQRGYGVTWWEVVNISIPWNSIADGVTGAIIGLAVDWARRRFKSEKGAKRPKYIAIYGPDGQVLKSVAIENPESEPEDRTAEDQAEAARLKRLS